MSTPTNGGEQAPAAAEPVTFDSVFNKHFGQDDGGWGDTGGDAATPAGDGTEQTPPAGEVDPDGEPGTDTSGADTLTDSESGEGAEDEQDEGELTDTDTGADADPSQDPDAQSPEAKAESQSFFDRKKIDAISDPAARKLAQDAFNSMQAAFTQKTQQLAQVRKVAEAARVTAEQEASEYQSFVADMQTPEGAEQFLLMMTERKDLPQVFTEQVLVDVALKLPPEVIEKVISEYQRLTEDADAQETFQGKLELKRDKFERERVEREQVETQRAQQKQQLATAISAQAAKHKVTDPDSLDLIRGQVTLLIQSNHAAGRKTTLADVQAVVDKVAPKLAGGRARARDEGKADAEKEQRRKRAEEVRSAAERAKGPAGGPSGSRVPAPNTPLVVDEKASGHERLAAAVDRFFG
jgi:hypothetical protein